MPRGFVGKSVKKFFQNTEDALTQAGEAHNRNPFDNHRANHSVPLPNLPTTTNISSPFTPEQGLSGGSHAMGVGNSSNVVVDPDVLETAVQRMDRLDRQATDDMCNIANEIDEICSTIFVVPATVTHIARLTDEFKKHIMPGRYVTEDMVIDVRRFMDQTSNTDHGNMGVIAMSRPGADQAIQRVSSSIDRQISNMERTVGNYQTRSETIKTQAERERRRADQLSTLL